ncbi:putative ribosomal biogenesis regulatory protein [Septoria linicola]|nr:putative ribosomal biogenesis regulatory protein [Septoria linicola]
MEIDNGQAQPYVFDLGNLLVQDPNPLPSLREATTPAEKEAILSSVAQKCAQSLIHQLLAQPITRNESDGSLQISLPAPEFPLPREKPVPKEKEKTKWEKFAAKKGIKAKRKDGKLEFDEDRKEWKAKYGFGSQIRRNPGEVEADWIQEVDEKADKAKKEEGEKKGHGGKRKGMGDNAIRERKMSKKSKK